MSGEPQRRAVQHSTDLLVARMRSVATVASGMLRCVTFEELDTVIRTACVDILPHDVFTFALYQPDSHSLRFLAGWDGDVFEGGAVIPLAGTPSEVVVRERRPLLTRRSSEPGSHGARAFGTQRRSESVIRVPVMSEDRVLGVLSVQSYTPDAYSDEEVEIMEIFAAVAASAMLNIELLDEQKAMAAALRASEARFRQVVDHIREAFWLFDCAAERLLYVSPGYERIWDAPVSELYHNRASWLQTIHPEDQAMVRSALARQAQGDYDIEYRIVRPDGSVRWVRDRAFPIADENGTVVRIAGIAEDVTEERLREEQLRRAERLAAVGTLIGGVAHELNNPLQAIRGFTDLMLQGDVTEEDREALETIAREARRAASIVAELRLLARRSHDAAGPREPVDLNDIVTHVLRTRAYSLASANIEVRQDLARSLPSVHADPAQIEQVVLNLIVNASQALATVSRERRIIVRTRRTHAGCAISVVDNGPGIEAGHLPRLFDPFWTTKPPGEGTGLGLSVVQTIVSEHGGTVHVDSEAGRGTHFRVDLPLCSDPLDPEQSRHNGTASRTVPAPERSLRLLVVDDEDALRRMLVRMGERRGHRVDTAREGAEALQLFLAAEEQGDAYDVVFSDLHMPGVSGREFTERLLNRDPEYARRLFLLTGAVDTTDIAWIRERTEVAVLHKPFSLVDLLRVLEPFERAQH